ncbi:F0F1 ATP synthase subunit B [uncultured Paraglaciecola sp.]|uniref:F0F1 ATP synthase subunit B n=1 Tax=uncultured Paraglaciecola sp. TaxID=1765024 RepID=UPI0030DB13E1|tara:strand:- start:3523 stop:4335 length:813 start_codon:yes stop_codon:yes gene_type:complete
MPIDWFTVIAQAINFLILLWLLKRFLYRPIIDGLDARESKIAGILADADNKKKQALELQNQYEKSLNSIEQQGTKIVASAKKEAELTAKNILDEARQSADILLKKRLAAMQQEISQSRQDVLQESMREVYALCRKILGDLADNELENMLFEKLIQRLNTLEENQSSELKHALVTSGNRVLVRSVFSLSDAQLSRLQHCLQDKFVTDKQQKIELTQSLVPQLITGVELTLNGWKISWSAQNYLTELQQQVEAVLDLSPSKNNTDEHMKPAN